MAGLFTTHAQTLPRGEMQRPERRSELAHSVEVAETRLQIQEAFQNALWTQTDTHQAEMRAQNETHQAEMRAQNETSQAEMRAEYETHQAEMRAQNETHQAEMRAYQAEIRAHQVEMRAQNETQKFEMRDQNETHEVEMRALQVEMRVLNEMHQAEMRAHNETRQAEMRALQVEMKIQNEMHQVEMRAHNETHQAEMRDQNETHQAEMRDQNETHQAEMRACQAEMRAQNETHQAEMKTQSETHQAEMRAHQAKMRAQNETHQVEMRTQSETHQAEMSVQIEAREQERKILTNEVDSLKTEVTRMTRANKGLQATVASVNKTIGSKNREISSNKAALTSIDATLTQKESELASKNVILEHQSSTIRELNEQLTRAREFLSGQKPQPHPLHPQAKITWEPCRDLPVKMSYAQTVVIRGKVYYGGGMTTRTNHDDSEYRVFCYSPSEDTWSTVLAPVQSFGLSQLKGKLVTVGGKEKSDGKVTNEVYEFDEVTQSWKQSIPPMHTARRSPAVLSHRLALIVAGGNAEESYATRTKVVEVFREETSQWYTTEPLPFRWINPSSLLINNKWYLLGGGADGEIYSNRVVCAHVDLLLQKALPGDQASNDRNGSNSSAWEALPNTPHYGPAATTFGASLLAVGGNTTTAWPPEETQATVYVYSPCTDTWIHISDLPTPRVWTATAMLSPTEVIVVGGWNELSQQTVYKGLIQIK